VELIASLRDADQAIELTPASPAMTERYDDAIGTALANKRIPFTISEMDARAFSLERKRLICSIIRIGCA
jgi:hypothetical protein